MAQIDTLPYSYLTRYYAVRVSAAKMPSSCRGSYGRVGLIRVLPGGRVPGQIRHTRTARVVRTWERYFWGRTPACALRRAEAHAREIASEQNGIQIAWSEIGGDVY